MPTSDAKLTPTEARAVLGVSHDAGMDAARAAFRAAAKLAHPDRPGGDAARFRRIVAAYRTLQGAPALPALAAPTGDEGRIELSPYMALKGGEADVILIGGRRLRARVPAGARQGERLTIGQLTAIVSIDTERDIQVRGDDVWVTARTQAFILAEGGRAELNTPLGPRTLWISRAAAARRLVRVDGEGLPARGPRPAGHLFLRLTADEDFLEGPARAHLRRFAAAWAA